MGINSKQPFTVILADKNKKDAGALHKALRAADGHVIAADGHVIEVCSIPATAEAIFGKKNVAFVLIDEQLLKAADISEITLLKEKINKEEIPVIILTEDKQGMDEALAVYDFDLADVLEKSAGETAIINKIKIFTRLYSYRKERISSAEEKKCPDLQHFIQVLAHDLKSPLATSVFLLSILKADKQAENESSGLKEYVHKIYETNVHLSEMITLVADHFKNSLKDQRKEMTHTGDMLRDVISSITKKGGRVFKLTGDFPILYTNKLKLQHIFELLLFSLADHSYYAGDILICVNDKDVFYEFSIMYDPCLKTPELKKIFLIPGAPETINEVSKISLNVLKMLVEEQCGSIRSEEKPGKKSFIFLEWRK